MQPGTILIGLGLVLLILLDTYDPRFISSLRPALAKAILGRFDLHAQTPSRRERIEPRSSRSPRPAEPDAHADLLQEMDVFCRWLEQRRTGPVGG